MDRFIASGFLQPTYYQSDLKSNMDRFIASKWIQLLMFSISFKIQYG